MSTANESPREDFERCVRFEQRIAARASTSVHQVDLGTLFLNRDLPRVWNRNFLWLGPQARNVDAPQIIDATERLLSEAGLEHRKYVAATEHIRPDVATDLHRRGWARTELATMVLRDPSIGGLSSDVREVSPEDYVDFNRTIIGESSSGGPEVVDQLVQLGLLMAKAGNARFFVARSGDKPVSGTQLYSDGRTTQIEDVGTLEAYRRRGLAKKLMKHVIAEAFDNVHDMLFLVAEADEWPKVFYERLGFDLVGYTVEDKLEPPDEDSEEDDATSSTAKPGTWMS